MTAPRLPPSGGVQSRAGGTTTRRAAPNMSTMTTITHDTHPSTTDAPRPTSAPPTWPPPARWARWSAYAVAAWALAFAGVNLYLQFGGLSADNPLRDAFGAMTVMNLLVAVLKVAGAAFAVATVQRWGRRAPRWLLTAAMWTAGGLLLLYAGMNLGMLVATGQVTAALPLAGGQFVVPGWAYAAFFGVPGLLYAAAGRDYQRRSRTDARWALLGLLGAPVMLGTVLFGVPALLRLAGLLPG